MSNVEGILSSGWRYLLYQRLSGVLPHLLDLLAASSRTHSPGIAVVVLLLLELDVRAVARYYDGAAGLSASQARAQGGVAGLGLVLVADRTRRRGSAHVVWIRGPAVNVEDCDSRVGSRR